MLTYTLENQVAVLRMDDGKANALSHAMIDALLAAIERAENEASAMVLAGRPERFSAGFDLKVMTSGRQNAVDLLTRGAELALALYGAEIPLVIACTGHALAGGVLVALTGDLRIGADGPYKIGYNEVTIGLGMPVLAIELARDRLTRAELPRATMMAHIYDPQSALRAGYFDEVVPADEVVPRAIAEATRLGKLPKVAYRESKERLRGDTIAKIRGTLAADLQSLTVPTA